MCQVFSLAIVVLSVVVIMEKYDVVACLAIVFEKLPESIDMDLDAGNTKRKDVFGFGKGRRGVSWTYPTW